MIGIARNYELPPPDRHQIVLAHQSPDLFRTHQEALPLKDNCDPSISVITVRQHRSLNGIPHSHLGRGRFLLFPTPIEAGAVDTR
jgi:hypothetical protein